MSAIKNLENLNLALEATPKDKLDRGYDAEERTWI